MQREAQDNVISNSTPPERFPVATKTSKSGSWISNDLTGLSIIIAMIAC